MWLGYALTVTLAYVGLGFLASLAFEVYMIQRKVKEVQKEIGPAPDVWNDATRWEYYRLFVEKSLLSRDDFTFLAGKLIVTGMILSTGAGHVESYLARGVFALVGVILTFYGLFIERLVPYPR